MANNKMLIDAGHPEETRVAMVRGNRVDEFDFESEHKTQLRGNIYLAKVTRVEPSLQAAFVDYGGNRHGFLAFAEIHPDYYQIPVADRQALLEAEAADARKSAAEEDLDPDPSDDVEADSADADAEEKPKRKRRSRRRTKKASDKDENASQDESSDAIESSPESSDEAGEESDSDNTEMSAENENDDVVSQEAPKKPKRRTSRVKKKDTETKAAKTEPANDESAEEAPKKKRVSRSKKTDDSEEGKASTEAASAEQDDVAEQEKKLRKRRTSRKKAVADDDAVVEVSTEETALDAKDEKPKKATRRRTSRTKVEAEEVAADTTSEEAESGSTETPAEADEEKQPRARKSRSRSRRGKKNTKTDHDDGSNDAVEQLGSDDALEEVPQRRSNRRHYKIQEVIKRRQILLVQVVKEERGNKGAALTTYLSLAGRYSVLMPNTARGGGISRKITNAADRKRLKSIASALEVPQGMGVILRTAGASRDQEEIQRDFEYLMRLWENVRTLTLDSTAPCLVYEEGSLIKRSIRDLFDTDTSEIMVAGENGFKEAKDFMNMLMPSQTKKVKLYTDRIPMFAKMGVEAQLDAMLQPQVTLKSGGYLILDQTEALVAIDVNSGRSTRQHSIEETAVQTNLEAADEVARQLRLRDLAGLIVIDFIDMEDRRNVRAVEKRLKDALKNDRARIQVGRISHFGLMEMSRQRIRASVLESTTQTCPTCEGLGHVRSPSSVVLGVLRAIEEHLNRNSRNNLTIKVSTTTAIYLLNNKRESLSDLEIRFGVSLLIETDNGLGTTPCEIEKGEFSNRKPVQSAAVQADQVMDDDEESSISSEAASSSETRNEPADQGEDQGRKKRRRRRRRRGSNSEEETERDNSTEEASTSAAGESTREQISEVATEESEAKPAKRVRRKKKSDDEVVLEENAATSEDKEEKPKRRRRKSAETRVDEVETPVKEEASTARTTDDKPKRRTTRRKISEDEQSEEIEAVSDTPVADKSSDEKKPKKGGWWQRKFF